MTLIEMLANACVDRLVESSIKFNNAVINSQNILNALHGTDEKSLKIKIDHLIIFADYFDKITSEINALTNNIVDGAEMPEDLTK